MIGGTFLYDPEEMAPNLSYHSVSMAAPVIMPFVEEAEREERVIRGKQMEASPPVDYHIFNPLSSDFGVPRQNPPKKKLLSLELSKPLTSLELLTNYWSSMVKNPEAGKLPDEPQREFKVPGRKLSTEDVVRIAGARYIQFPDQSENYFSILTHPFGLAFSGLSEEDMKEIELVQLLLAAAEKVGDGQIDRTSRLLSYCELLASKRASPAQRVVLYFAEALRERIHWETRGVDLKNGYAWEGAKRSEKYGNSEIKQGLGTSLTSLTCHRQLPFTQVTQFTGLQSIIEHTSSARRIHIIDFEIRSGIQWIVLMQAFAERAKNNESVDESSQHPTIKLLRITAVVSNCDSRDTVEGTGLRLAEVAESMNLPFAFSSILIPGMEDIEENMFRCEHGETVVVYAAMVLRTMISRPGQLNSLMRAVRGLSPAVMVVTEVEANHNSPSFVGRFVEALFFYSAYFDCLEECMAEVENCHHRRLTEETLGEGIRNMVSKEGRERTARSVKIEVWRAFFGRFGMVEAGLSESSLYQASLVAKSRSSCSLELARKGLLVGWKGTPILSISAWKFQ